MRDNLALEKYFKQIGSDSMAYNIKSAEPDVIEEIRVYWSKRAGEELSRQDAKEIIHNLSGVINLLGEWDRESREAKSKSGVTDEPLDEIGGLGRPIKQEVGITDGCPVEKNI